MAGNDQDEHTPLLPNHYNDNNDRQDRRNQRHNPYDNANEDSTGFEHWDDPHSQFCSLAGIPPSDLPPTVKYPRPNRTTLYARAMGHRKTQNLVYNFTAALANTLLLSQVVLGAALTGLGASGSSHILITVFGALNTVIAGLITYLKSRGQPMRARMYRDDLDRVVDEIENSEVMWLGISRSVHGYDEINISDQVSVRSEVARLTRLYEKAVRNNTLNNPDNYFAGAPADGPGLQMRGRQAQPGKPAEPAPASAPTAAGAATDDPAPAVSAEPVDESPATAAKADEINHGDKKLAEDVQKNGGDADKDKKKSPTLDGDAANNKSDDAGKDKENTPPSPTATTTSGAAAATSPDQSKAEDLLGGDEESTTDAGPKK